MGNALFTNLIRWRSVVYGEPDLFVHAEMGDWGSLIERAFVRPADARYRDGRGNTALHVACRRQPPIDAVIALLRAFPEATNVRTIDGMNPLHFACYCGASIDVIHILIAWCRESASVTDKRGRTPLHCACEGYRTDQKHAVFKALLRIDPSMVSRTDLMSRTPLSLMLDDYIEEIEEATYGNIDDLTTDGTDANANHNHNVNINNNNNNNNNNNDAESQVSSDTSASQELRECLKCTTILLRAAYYGSVDDDALENEPFLLLHASVGVPFCPPHFVHLALKLEPDQIEKRDKVGNLPLHIAATTSHSSCLSSQFDVSFVVIDSLLSLYPKAARISNDDGKLPLALAVECGKSWSNGVRPILEVFPAALATVQMDRDLYYLYLEMIAADCSLSVLYEVILAKPEILTELTQTFYAKKEDKGEPTPEDDTPKDPKQHFFPIELT